MLVTANFINHTDHRFAVRQCAMRKTRNIIYNVCPDRLKEDISADVTSGR